MPTTALLTPSPTRPRAALLLACALMLAATAGLGAADAPKPLLHPLFSDAAVLQRGKPVAVWGWAAPGAEVTVVLAGDGLTAAPVTAKAGGDGRWQAALGPFAAGGPYTLTASAGEAKAEAKDILVGDVWLCGGQSNMEFTVARALNIDQEKAAANWPKIRHLQVAKNNAGAPSELISGQWKVCTPENVAGFTAVGYFFARKLHQDLQIPIGLVHSSWGGTSAEAWTSYEVLSTLPDCAKAAADYRKMAQEASDQKARTGKDYPALIAEWYQANDPGTAATPAWSDPALDASGWTAVTLPAVFADAGAIPATWDGTVWVRREVVVPDDAAGKPAALALGKIDHWDTVFVNGRQVGTAETPGRARSYRVPEKVLKAGTNVIALRLVDLAAGKGGINGKPEDLSLTPDGSPIIPLAGEWRLHAGIELAKAPPLPLRADRAQGPTSLYNGMLAPLVPMSLAGVIWYQGEANAGRAYQYRTLLPALIGDWRARFGQGNVPFLIVQLANYMDRQPTPSESNWAELREAQALTAQQVAKSGLAVTIDIGEAKDIHPKNKQEVGRRLALAAEAVAYGRQVEFSGPWYQGMTVEGPAIRLRFDHLGGGLVASDKAPLTGFAIAGEDRAFVWADARIDGDTVVVSSPDVAKPVAVRYAWGNNPACNLANQAGLPAVPFRTDDWPGSTWPKTPPPAKP